MTGLRDKRGFTTASTRIISDTRPSSTDIRVYLCVSKYDGMSLRKGKGRGCFASNRVLSEEIGCDYSTLSKSLRRLISWGYLTEERQIHDRRLTAYRVIFDGEGSGRDSQLVDLETVGESANHWPRTVDRNGHSGAETIGVRLSETSANLQKSVHDYIVRRLDYVETRADTDSDEAGIPTEVDVVLGRIEAGCDSGEGLSELDQALVQLELSMSSRQRIECDRVMRTLSKVQRMKSVPFRQREHARRLECRLQSRSTG